MTNAIARRARCVECLEGCVLSAGVGTVNFRVAQSTMRSTYALERCWLPTRGP